jgi:hypothetical protein
MGSKAELRAVLSLDNSKFVRGVKDAMALSKRMALQFKQNPGKFLDTAAILGAEKALRFTAKTAVVFGTSAAAGFILFTKKSIDAAASMQTMRAGFTTLLGSAGKAAERMQKLSKFAKDTPFNLGEVAEASRVLETLTEGAITGDKAMRMIGDTAAGTQRSFGDVATTIGRLYSALSAGQSAGEQLRSLQDMGAISGKSARKIGAMADAGTPKLSAEAWKLAEQALARFDGEMKRKSSTWEGMMSNFKDSIDEALRRFGDPFIKSLTPSLALLTASVERSAPKMEQMGKVFSQYVGDAITDLRGFFDNPEDTVNAFGEALKKASGSFMQDVWKDVLAGPSGANFKGNMWMGSAAEGLGGKNINPPDFPPMGQPGGRWGGTGGTSNARPLPFKSRADMRAETNAKNGEEPEEERPRGIPLPKKFRDTLRSHALLTGGLKTSSLPSSIYSAGRWMSAEGEEIAFGAGTGLSGGAHSQSPLLKHAQRKAIERNARIEAMARDPNYKAPGSTPNAYGVISRGDKAAVKAFQAREEKKAEEALTNGKFDEFFNEFMRFKNKFVDG